MNFFYTLKLGYVFIEYRKKDIQDLLYPVFENQALSISAKKITDFTSYMSKEIFVSNKVRS